MMKLASKLYHKSQENIVLAPFSFVTQDIYISKATGISSY